MKQSSQCRGIKAYRIQERQSTRYRGGKGPNAEAELRTQEQRIGSRIRRIRRIRSRRGAEADEFRIQRKNRV